MAAAASLYGAYISDMASRAPRPGWRQLFVTYRAAHTKRGTRITHMIGIPLIVLSVPALLVKPAMALTMFVAGWVLQLVGHYVFERNDPQFFGDKRNLLVGVVWTAIEWGRVLGARRERRHRRPPPSPPRP
jgi:uncharacterized membrane protein YGL010W